MFVIRDFNEKQFFDSYFQGLYHAYTLSHTVKTLISLHSTLRVAIKSECMLVLYRYTELLKVIELTYHRHAMALAPYFNSIMQFHSQRLLKIIGIAKVNSRIEDSFLLIVFCRNELHLQRTRDLLTNKSMFSQHWCSQNHHWMDLVGKYRSNFKRKNFVCSLRYKRTFISLSFSICIWLSISMRLTFFSKWIHVPCFFLS